MKKSLTFASVLFFLLSLRGYARESTPLELWFYYSTNLMVDENVGTLEKIWGRAAKAGYTKVLLSDYKFGLLGEMSEDYFMNVKRVKAIAEKLHIEIVLEVFPIGYSQSILSQDPNLAEGLPVKDAPFVVHQGEARLVPDPEVKLKGGDMKDLSLWDWYDKDTVSEDQGTAKITDPNGRNSRLVQKIKLTPFRQYHIAVKVKTRDFDAQAEIKILTGKDGEKSLNYANLGVQKTQDWTVHHVVFNSLDNSEATIYMGCWGGGKGELWWSDAKLEEVGLLNVLRRTGTPLTVKTEAGKVLVEGKDFASFIDPRMGTVPWPGNYETWHEPPVLKTPNLPDGTRLRVSYYFPTSVYDGQVMICLSEPKTDLILRDQAKRMSAAFGTKAYFMGFDEIRVMGWDEACGKSTPGEILSKSVSDCTAMLKEVNPGGTIYVWNDMFDPNLNAHQDYYLVKGDLAGSWKGLSKDVIAAVWDVEQRDKSIAWFEGRGEKMLLAGYYDMDTAKNVKWWMDSAKGRNGILGIMYTTWENNYDHLEEFAKEVRKY